VVAPLPGGRVRASTRSPKGPSYGKATRDYAACARPSNLMTWQCFDPFRIERCLASSHRKAQVVLRYRSARLRRTLGIHSVDFTTEMNLSTLDSVVPKDVTKRTKR
jgi:hypothetical protein